MSDLSSIFAIESKIKIGDKEITIKGISLGDIPMVTGIVGFFTEANLDIKKVAMELLSNHIELVYNLFAATTDLSLEEIKKLNLAASMIIFNKVVQENSDFLVQQVIPQLSAMTKNLDGMSKSKN